MACCSCSDSHFGKSTLLSGSVMPLVIFAKHNNPFFLYTTITGLRTSEVGQFQLKSFFLFHRNQHEHGATEKGCKLCNFISFLPFQCIPKMQMYSLAKAAFQRPLKLKCRQIEAHFSLSQPL